MIFGKVRFFSNFKMFEWIKCKLVNTCLIPGFSFYYIKQIDKILPLSDRKTTYIIG